MIVLVLVASTGCAGPDAAYVRRAEIRRHASQVPRAGLLPGLAWGASRAEVLARFGTPSQTTADGLVYYQQIEGRCRTKEYGFSGERLTWYRCLRDANEGDPVEVEALVTERLGIRPEYPNADKCYRSSGGEAIGVVVGLLGGKGAAGSDCRSAPHAAEWVTKTSTVRLDSLPGAVEVVHRARP